MMLYKLFYTFGGVGYIKIAPGTFASALTFTLIYLLSVFFLKKVKIILLILFLTCIIVFNLLKNRFFILWGSKDPQCVVIDEVIGILLYVLFLNNLKLKCLITGFVVFRFFDIIKPFPLKWLQNINNINSVILDDIGAGIYTYIVVYIVMKLI